SKKWAIIKQTSRSIDGRGSVIMLDRWMVLLLGLGFVGGVIDDEHVDAQSVFFIISCVQQLRELAIIKI
ncbi:hypothetical protein ACJX0J_035958, partial [Zea mays]